MFIFLYWLSIQVEGATLKCNSVKVFVKGEESREIKDQKC